MKTINIINGPNLNLLGYREKSIYGEKTLEEINNYLLEKFKHKANLCFFQSNHEGEIIDHIHSIKDSSNGIIINPAGLTHTSIVLRDALLSVNVLFIEVHLSNIYKREEFRRKSLISDIAQGVISGLGPYGYECSINMLCCIT